MSRGAPAADPRDEAPSLCATSSLATSAGQHAAGGGAGTRYPVLFAQPRLISFISDMSISDR